LKHSFVSKGVIGRDSIEYVTNGVHHKRWVHDELAKLFNRRIPDWEESPSRLVGALSLPSDELAQARAKAKKSLLSLIKSRTDLVLKEDVLTVTVAKRFTAYKRNGMILSNPDLLGKIASEKGEIQVVFAGKAHPKDGVAKGMLIDIIKKADALNRGRGKVKVAILENYDIALAKALVAGSDVWLNNPRRPLEACGTSGMKAAMNGVLNLSVYDGWWLEGAADGLNGWGIGRKADWGDFSEAPEGEDEKDLYSKLSDLVLPLYYGDKAKWLEMSKYSIATVGPKFNSYRMMTDYLSKVYSKVLRVN